MQLCWNGHVTQMSHKQRAKQLTDALLSGKRPRGQPRTRWRNYVEDLARSRLEIPPAKLPLVAGDRNAWRSQLELLPTQHTKNKPTKKYTRLIQCFPENDNGDEHGSRRNQIAFKNI